MSLTETPITSRSDRILRSRKESLSHEPCLPYLFDKPMTISNSGVYSIGGPNLSNLILMNDIIPAHLGFELQKEISNKADLRQHKILVNGKPVYQPRLSAFYGPADYSFSGLTMKAIPTSNLPKVLETDIYLRNVVENAHGLSLTSDSHLINLYRNGSDSCGFHADNEPLLDKKSPIYCLSLGATRTLTITTKEKGSKHLSVVLTHGSLLIMREGFQDKFLHAILKDPTCKDPRTSITSRKCCPIYLASLPPCSPPAPSPYLAPNPSIDHTSAIAALSPLAAKKYVGPASSPITQPLVCMGCQTDVPPPETQTLPIPVNTPAFPLPDTSLATIAITPLSLESTLAGIDSLKRSLVITELERHKLPTTGLCPDLKKRLKAHMKRLYKSYNQQPTSPMTADQNSQGKLPDVTTPTAKTTLN